MISQVVEGLDHPESVAVGPDGLLYAGGEAGQIYKIDPSSSSVELLGSTGGFVLGIALDGNGNVYACDIGIGALMRIDAFGEVSVVSRGTKSRQMITPNFPVFDPEGALYVSDSGVWPDGGGCIYKFSPSGRTEVWSDAAPRFTNGLALSPEADWLYVAESTLPGITRIAIEADGTAGRVETVTLMPDTVPDGLAFDKTGRLYIGCYRPDRIYTLEAGGSLQVFADDFQGTVLSAPTNLAFGGDSMNELFIASLGRWHIGRAITEHPGQRLHYPTGLIPMEGQ